MKKLLFILLSFSALSISYAQENTVASKFPSTSGNFATVDKVGSMFLNVYSNVPSIYSALVAYGSGRVVIYSDKFWRKISSAGAGTTPSEGANWTQVSGIADAYPLSGNPSGFLTNITGKITAGTNVTITGAGTAGSPYSISASGGGGGTIATSSQTRTGTDNTVTISPLQLRTEFNKKLPLAKYNVLDFGAVGDYSFTTGLGTDNTAAFQACINAIAASGKGGVMYVPVPVGDAYLIDGDFDLATYSQLVIPAREFATDQPFILHILGEVQPTNILGILVSTNLYKNEVILYSKKKNDAVLFPSMLGGANLGSGGGVAPGFSNVQLKIENLTFRRKWFTSGLIGPGICGLNLRYINGVELDNVKVDTDVDLRTSAEPTYLAPAIFLPRNSNGDFVVMNNVSIGGGGVGVIASEHALGTNIYIAATKYAWVQTFGDHPAYLSRCSWQWNQNLLVSAYDVYGSNPAYNDYFPYGAAGITIGQIQVEHFDDPTKWYYTQYDIKDSRNELHGSVNYQAARSYIGYQDVWNKLNGRNLICENAYTKGRLQAREMYTATTLGTLKARIKAYNSEGEYIGVVPVYADDTSPTLQIGLSAYYDFNEISGSRYDALGLSTPFTGGATLVSPGFVGNSCNIDGTTSFFQATSCPSLQLGGADFTIAFILNTPPGFSGSTTGSILSKWRASTNKREWEFEFGGGGISWYKSSAGTSGTVQGLSITGLVASANYLVVLRWDNATSTASLSVNNGVFSNSAVLTGGVYNSDSPLNWGNLTEGGYPVGVSFDELGIWKGRKISAGEETTLWNAGRFNTNPF